MSVSDEKPVSEDTKPKTGQKGDEQNDQDKSYQGKRPRKPRRGKNKYKNKNSADQDTASSFKGATEDMNGHVFQVAGETGVDNQKQFQKTLEALQEYASKNLENPSDIKSLFTDMVEPTIKEPEDHASLDGLSALQRRMWNKAVDKYIDRVETLKNNKDTMWAVIWGQCSKTMQSKLLAMDAFEEMKKQNDCLGLLKAIMATSYKFDSTYHPYESVHEAKKRYYSLSQRWDEPVREWAERFTGVVEMLESYEINVCEDAALLRHEAELRKLDTTDDGVKKWTAADKEQYETCKKVASERSLAMGFMKGACQYRFGALLKQLRNDYVQNVDRYPRDIISAQSLLTHYRKPVDAKFRKDKRGGGGDSRKQKDDDVVPDVAFAQQGEKVVPGTDGKVKPTVRCHGCNQLGHMKNECPNSAPPKDTSAEDLNLFQHDLRGTSDDGDGVTFLQLDDVAEPDEDMDIIDDGPLPGMDGRGRDDAASDASSSFGSMPPLYDLSADAVDDNGSRSRSSTSGPDPGTSDILLHASLPSFGDVLYAPDASSPDEALARVGRLTYAYRCLGHPALSALSDGARAAVLRHIDPSSVHRGDQVDFSHLSSFMGIDDTLRSLPIDGADDDSFAEYADLHPTHPSMTGPYVSSPHMGVPWGPRAYLPSHLRRNGDGDFVLYHDDFVAYRENDASTVTSATALSSSASIASASASEDHASDSEDHTQDLDFTFLEVGTGSRPRQARVNPLWILLDSESTVSIFCNRSLLRNIRRSPRPHLIYSNGGVLEVSLIGDYPNFGTVWFDPTSLANILSLAAVRKVCRVTMDSAVSPSFVVHHPNGRAMRFQESRRGLYYFDATPASLVNDSNPSKPSVSDYSFVNTVAENESNFTRREIEGAKVARTLYGFIGRPAYQKFLRILDNNEILNCPVTSADAKRAEYIYGPDVAVLKGKTVRSPTSHVLSYAPITLPDHILKFHRHVTLCADVFKVQGIRFLHTITRKIQLRSVEELSSGTAQQLLSGIKTMQQVYHNRGFEVTSLHADNDFKPIEQDILPTKLNTCAANEHVGEVERSIRTVKNTIRCTIQSLPFKRYPKQMVRSLVKLSVSQLNMFVAKDGISATMSPKTIVTGEPKPDYNNISKIGFGAYVQTHEEPDPSNTMEERSTGAIALRPIGNLQGGYYFLSLTTWKVIRRRKWTELPMPRAVLEAVHQRAKEEGQPLIKNGNFEFTWASTGERVDDDETENNDAPNLDDDDEDEDENEHNDPLDIDDDENSMSDEDHDDVLAPREPLLENINIQEEVAAIMDEENIEDVETDNEDESSVSSDQRSDNQGLQDERSDVNDDDIEEQQDVSTHSIENKGAEASSDDVGSRYNLRKNRKRAYDHTYPGRDFSMLSTDERRQSDSRVKMADVVFTQMSARKGIEKHGQVAIDAMVKEYAQLDDLNVFEPLSEDSLTSEQKKNALGSVDLIKEKRCGKIKGRTCADGRPQRAYISKEESTSPTISLEALIITLIIDAHEKRDVATADISGAFLRGTNEDFDVMKVVGQMVDNVVAANPERYKPFVCFERGKKVLYLRLVKAMYGLLKAAIIWWKLFSGQLEKMGFEINPYDKCVANKMIDGKQCTIGWYVDDIKVSHADPKVVDNILLEIEKHFDKLTITRGPKHVYVGMDIEFLDDGRVKITTIDYIKESIASFGEDIKRTANTPAKKNLFEVDPASKQLDSERADIFHSITAKLLWVSRRSRLDIQTAIAFLCTRVQKPTEEDWIKLRRVLQYLKGTIDMPRIVSARTMHLVNTYVDAAYAVHMDMKSHTGGCVSMGDGVVQGGSKKQSLNTKSSTEAEVVGASDYLPFTIWYKYFLEHQGYDTQKFVFYQDNQSAMKLEKNGIDSARQRSRHINIRYFFIKERTKSLGIDISYCPTEVMVGDFFSKPLQGSLFRKFRDVIQGLMTIESLNESYMSSLKERVGKRNDDEVGFSTNDNEETKTEKNDQMTNDQMKKGSEVDKFVQKETAGDNEAAVMKRSYAEVVVGKNKSRPNK